GRDVIRIIHPPQKRGNISLLYRGLHELYKSNRTVNQSQTQPHAIVSFLSSPLSPLFSKKKSLNWSRRDRKSIHGGTLILKSESESEFRPIHNKAKKESFTQFNN
ncbi:hypothetical protein TorRG33x02_239230, partial [Trema orientale]